MGRPRSRLINDSDKYVVACIDGLMALDFGVEHACAMGVAALLVGITGEADRFDGRHVVTNWERYRTRAAPQMPATLEGLVSTFRDKRRRYRAADDLRWRTAMGAAFQAVFALTDQQQAKRAALIAAMTVGEAEFARAKLWPMIDARFSGQFRINAGEPDTSAGEPALS